MSFVHGAILGGLALASLPIIIHLLNRRRFKTFDWAAMEFLLKAAIRNRRRVRLENLLLLLLRTLIVVLLVLAVARPFTQRSDAFAGLLGVEGATERIVLLDDSHSMRAGQGNQSAFDTARRLITTMVTRLNEEKSSDRVTVVLGSQPRGGQEGFTRVAVASDRYKQLLSRLDGLRASDGVLDIPAAIETILENHPDRGTRLVLHVVTDFRRKDWTDSGGSLRPDLRKAFDIFKERGEIKFLDVGSNPVQNLGVVDLVARDRAVVAGVPATFVATVKNHGPDDVSDVQVTFRFGETALPAVRIEGALKPGEGGARQVTHEYTFRGDGPVSVSASVRTDILPGDDTRRLVVNVRKRMRFLLVDGEPEHEHYRGETDFLAAALMPPGRVASGIEVDPVPEQSFHARELEAYDGVFLCNVYRLPEERVQRLEEFVRGGGGLVFFLGDQVDAQVYNATFYGKGENAGKGLLPLYLLEMEGSTDDYFHLAPPVADHPVIRFLRGMNEIVFRTVAVKRFIGSRTTAALADTRVILSYTDDEGSPALAEKAFGAGRVLLFTTSADLEWSDFPRSILFVAILQETARYVVKPDPGDTTLLVSTPIRVPFEPTRMQRTATLVPPQKQGGSPAQLTLAEDRESGRLSFFYARTRSAGAYRLRLKTPEGEEYLRKYVLNMDPAEGDLRRVARLSDLAGTVGADLERGGERAFDTDESDRTEFWRTLVYALLICAALETLLAWRFGHHSKRSVATDGKQVFVR